MKTEVRELPHIERWLVDNSIFGGPSWRDKEPIYESMILAYGWSDGLVTWKNER